MEAKCSPHNNANWYTDTDGFLEHSPNEGSLYHKGPALQKIILIFFGCPSYVIEQYTQFTEEIDKSLVFPGIFD